MQVSWRVNGRTPTEVLQDLCRHGSQIRTDASTYSALLQWCGEAKALQEGISLYRHILTTKLRYNTMLLNFVLRMYVNCGAMDEASALFGNIHQPNQHTWNFIISAYARYGPKENAFKIFSRMENYGILPNKFVYASILCACGHSSTLAHGKCIHARTVTNGLEKDIAVGSGIINMYSKCGQFDKACEIFNAMPDNNAHSWTSIITAFGNHERPDDAFRSFKQMQQEGAMPTKTSYVSIVSAFGCKTWLSDGRRVHVSIICEGHESDDVVATSLVSMYAKCGHLDVARILFFEMMDFDEKSWNAIISGHTLHGEGKIAINLYSQMLMQASLPNKFILASIISACASLCNLAEGTRVHASLVHSGSDHDTDLVVQNALVNMYGKCGSLSYAHSLFNNIKQKDKFLWTSMIVSLCEHGKADQAIQIFARMQQVQVKPDSITFSSILSACANKATLNEGELIHAYVVEAGVKIDLAVGNALVSMYSKCGHLSDAENVFDRMGVKDTVSWNAMITAYMQHGHSKIALSLFDQMLDEGFNPNGNTFVNVLSACSRVGMVDEGCHYFACMTDKHGIEPLEDHYNCMIDLFGRVGRLDEAEEFISKMPMEPSVISWTTLLSACKTKTDLSKGIKYANKLFQLVPSDTAPYFLLADLYSRVGMEDAAAKMLHSLNTKQARSP